LPLLGDARETLLGIAEQIPEESLGKKSEWAGQANRARDEYETRLAAFEKSLGDAIHPFAVARVLERVAPDDAFFAVDPGISAVYSAAFTRLAKAGRRTAYNFAMGALGYAIPAAIGAKTGLPGKTVIGLVGDGSFGFAAGELETAARLGLDITYVLFDNRSFGWIRGTELVAKKAALSPDYGRFTNFAGVDYVKISEGFGLRGFQVGSISEFERVLRECVSIPGAKLIALETAPEDELLPPVPGWFRYAKSKGLENLYGIEGIKIYGSTD
jgi:acetolactate synthase-1/2/3 large subunit